MRCPNFLSGSLPKKVPVMPTPCTPAPGESVIRERILHLPVAGRFLPRIETTRFAAANHLCVEVDDLGERHVTHIIEPYSLRRAERNEIVLHACNVENAAHHRFHVNCIQDSRVSNRGFIPRYALAPMPA